MRSISQALLFTAATHTFNPRFDSLLLDLIISYDVYVSLWFLSVSFFVTQSLSVVHLLISCVLWWHDLALLEFAVWSGGVVWLLASCINPTWSQEVNTDTDIQVVDHKCHTYNLSICIGSTPESFNQLHLVEKATAVVWYVVSSAICVIPCRNLLYCMYLDLSHKSLYPRGWYTNDRIQMLFAVHFLWHWSR